MVGATGQGKSWYAKQALRQVATRTSAAILIYSPVDFNGWPGRARVFNDVERFVAALEQHIRSGARACHVYVDEFGDINAYYRHYSRYPKVLQQITSLSRHYGITAWLASQRPTDIPPVIRNNCKERIIFFLVGEDDRRAMHNESPVKEIGGVPMHEAIGHLQKLEAFVIKGREVIKRRLA